MCCMVGHTALFRRFARKRKTPRRAAGRGDGRRQAFLIMEQGLLATGPAGPPGMQAPELLHWYIQIAASPTLTTPGASFLYPNVARADAALSTLTLVLACTVFTSPSI